MKTPTTFSPAQYSKPADGVARAKRGAAKGAVRRNDPWQPRIKQLTKQQWLKRVNLALFRGTRRMLNTTLKGAAVAKRKGKDLVLHPEDMHRGAVTINGRWISKPTVLKPGDQVRMELNVYEGVQVKSMSISGAAKLLEGTDMIEMSRIYNP